MRKTSAYARKMRRENVNGFNGAEWLNTIQKCQPYSDEPVMGSWITEGTGSILVAVQARIHMAFRVMADGNTPKSNTEDFDLLAHAVGIAVVRAIQIAGEFDNPMLTRLHEGTQALFSIRARRVKWTKWEMLGTEEAAIREAIAIYETILEASSPAQMSKASIEREKILKGKTHPSLSTGAL